MRVVIDTNVLVSALIKQGTPPAAVLVDLMSGELVPLYDQRILDEYREVLARPKFKIPAGKIDAVLDLIAADGVEVKDAHFAPQLPDPDDQPFADVAFAGRADLLITGNTKDFSVGRVFRVVTPREWSSIKTSMRLLGVLGHDERLALEANEPHAVAIACKRCGKVRAEEVLGLTPTPLPQRAPFPCSESDRHDPVSRCGGEVWTYDDNDVGRQHARRMAIPVRH